MIILRCLFFSNIFFTKYFSTYKINKTNFAVNLSKNTIYNQMRKTIITLIMLSISLVGLSQVEDSLIINAPVVPTIILGESDFETDNQSHDISGLLSASKDIFVNTAGYTFGQARFRTRGYDSRETQVLMNGLRLNDAETGRPYWGNWGGLNDVTRSKVNTYGLLFSDYSYGGIGGITNIQTRASEIIPGTSISYSLSNKSYAHRMMVSHSTGLMENGWAFSASASTRLAQEGYITGTSYEAYSYFFSAEKKLNKKHSIGLIAWGSPSTRGKSSAVVQEAYDLTGDNYYNPNWGYQNGEIRNSKIGTFHQPRAILSHYWDIDKTTKITTSVSYTFGRGGSTALNWYDAPDPRPDYYRNLPSYYEEDDYLYGYYTDMWQNNESFRQLDWDSFYDANRKNLYTVENVSGITGNDVTGNRAKYIVEERRYDVNRFDFSTLISKDLKEKGKLVAGANIMSNKTHNYKIVDDLLGADWWLDIDQFAERDFSDDDYIIQNNVDEPNRIVKEGDVFGYDYVMNINTADVFAQAEYEFSKIEVFGGLNLSYSEFWRTGNMRNGKFPIYSDGNSTKNTFWNYNVKGGLNYKITGRNFLQLNATYLTRAPYSRDSYVSPRTRDHVIDGLTSEKIYSSDLSYIYRSPKFQFKITGYYTDFKDGIKSTSFYHDELRTFVNYAMSGIDKVHYGGELGSELKLSTTISANLAVAYGRYLYNNRPTVTIAQDNSSEVLAENRTVYIKGYHVGSMPEFASSVGLKYNAPKYWFIGVNANYFAENYVNINPEKHTEEALSIFVDTDSQLEAILDQEKLKPGFSIDIWGGKSWRVNDYRIGFTLSVNNLLNNTELATSGFEQYRFDNTDIDKFPNKYYYMYGRTYFINVYFRF